MGAAASEVGQLMLNFHVATRLSLGVLRSRLGRAPGKSAESVALLVPFIAQTVSTFQDIHPFADGNGHIGRLLVWVVLGHFDMLPDAWWLHQNPGDEWNSAVHAHQVGEVLPLQRFLIESLM
jgi:hypothetical protein